MFYFTSFSSSQIVAVSGYYGITIRHLKTQPFVRNTGDLDEAITAVVNGYIATCSYY